MAGLCPFNPGVFTKEDYAPSFVTDRPLLHAASSQAESNEEPLQPSSSSAGIEMDIDEPPQQSATDQDYVSQAAFATIKREKLKKELNEECYKKARVIMLMRIWKSVYIDYSFH
ncbi:hypothetical protein ACJJTC_016603 [Scirpophaga incertulas]